KVWNGHDVHRHRHGSGGHFRVTLIHSTHSGKSGTTMKNIWALLLLAVAVASVETARAADIDGVKIDDKVVLAKGVPELVLNGAGLRHKFAFIKVYIGSLYLTQKKNDNEAVFADPGPKRVSMYILSS